MLAAWLLTAAALAGIIVGMLGRSPAPSSLLAAAGGGLLVGICAFWVLPEMAVSVGHMAALALVAVVSLVLLIADRVLLHDTRGGRHILLPLLLATAIHSFLDGWSVRALWTGTLDRIAVGIGLGLHKIPEGIAVGWVMRRGLGRTATALGAAMAVELVTPIGAWTEPYAQRSGFATFGSGWSAFVLAIVGGTFLFLGVHSVVPQRKNVRVLAMFLASFAAAGLLSLAGAGITL
jgi:zinc transporter ZupT